MKSETERHELLNILKAAVVYFALVFGAGFVLGPIRILFIVPRFGVRLAELMEFPVMLVVIVLTSRWLVRKFQLPHLVDRHHHYTHPVRSRRSPSSLPPAAKTL